jgi:hypothetical protein
VHTLNQRLAAEWQDLAITYPLWLSTLVMDDVYYTATLVLTCVTGFEVGMIIGMINY